MGHLCPFVAHPSPATPAISQEPPGPHTPGAGPRTGGAQQGEKLRLSLLVFGKTQFLLWSTFSVLATGAVRSPLTCKIGTRQCVRRRSQWTRFAVLGGWWSSACRAWCPWSERPSLSRAGSTPPQENTRETEGGHEVMAESASGQLAPGEPGPH